jgi:hypothetical protein
MSGRVRRFVGTWFGSWNEAGCRMDGNKYTPRGFNEQTPRLLRNCVLFWAGSNRRGDELGTPGCGGRRKVRPMLAPYNRYNPDFRQGLPILLN